MTVVKPFEEIQLYFYNSIKPVVILAGLFGVIPIASAHKSSPKRLKFSWCHYKVIYAMVIFTFLITIFILSLRNSFKTLLYSKSDAKDITVIIAGIIFHFSAVFSVAFFLYVAKNLQEMMTTWDQIAIRLIKYFNFNGSAKSTSLHYPQKKMVLITVFIMTSALMDRALHDARYALVEIMCPNHNWTVAELDITTTTSTYTRCYLENNAQFMVQLLGYQNWVAALMIFYNILTSFCWNFLDLFIILLSCGLHHNFTHMNKFLDVTKRVQRRPEEWRAIREDHLALAHLVYIVDSVISVGILYSYAANLISICTQMFLGLRSILTLCKFTRLSLSLQC